MSRRPLAALFAFTLAMSGACTHPRPARFADVEPIEQVADDQPIAVPKRTLLSPLSYSDVFSRRPVVDAMDLERLPDARDVNSLDEVPPSSWFVHPAGGPLGAVVNVVNGPPQAPMLVLRRFPESGRSGLAVIDARGLRYELGRDPPDAPFMRTTAAAVATPLMRAMGYRTPEVTILGLSESDLRLEVIDGEAPPTAAVREFFNAGPPPEGGRYRVSATRWPIGVDVGATPPLDPRDDDPNDRVSHPDRRTLRVLKIVRSWLRAPDFGIRELRDVYIGAPNKGHLLHFVIGLEGALGADEGRGEAAEPRSADPDPDPTAGENPLHLLVTLGLERRERRRDPKYPHIADFDEVIRRGDGGSIGFEPTYRMMPADAYWAAKQMAAISREVIAAAVDRAESPDAVTRDRLIEILEARRIAVIAEAFAKVTPCDVVRTDLHAVLLRDLGFQAAARTSYEATFSGDDGASLAPPRSISPGAAVFAIPIPSAPYIVLRLRVVRNGVRAPREVEVHLRTGSSGLHVVGVRH